MASNITFDIIGRDRSGSSAFEKVAKSAGRADGAMSRFSAGAMKVAKAGMFALGAGAVVAGKGLYEMAQSAAEDELAQKKLALTLKNTTGATDSQVASVERWITAQGKALGVADDELRPALQRLAEGSGDVAEAQRLASIAMDVSAGTGRSLKTVSEALLRAQNGATAGLSRYGIATKDAKGETLSFEEITRRMAQTFEGQAEKAAETTAGKFARLKLILSETGEEIGAKLIPYASDLADAFLDKGVPAIEALGDKAGPVFRNLVEAGGDIKDAVQPAVEEIAEALGNLATEGKGAGQIFDNVFLPALRGTADVIAHVVDFVDDLPGPVKDVGVQAAIAAIALHKLNGAMLAIKGSAFVTTMMDADARTASFGRTARGVAGVGGILALTKAFQDAGDEGASFGDVLTGAAGGAGIGAMFGPIGALVGAGAGGGLAALRGAFADTKDEARTARLELLRTEGFQNAKDDAASLSEALAGVVNQYGKVTRAAVESSFMGDDGQLDADVQALRDLGVSMDTIVSATLGQADAQAIVNDALNSGLGSLQSSADAAKAAYDDVSDGARDVVTATGEVIKNGEMLSNDEIDIYEQAWKDAKAAVDEMTATQDVFNDRTDKSTGAIKDHRAQMRQLASDMGIPLKAYKDFPKEVRTRFEAQGIVQTGDDAVKLIGQYEGLQRFDRIKAVVSAPGVDLTAQQVKKLHDRYDLTPKQVRTLIATEGLPFTVKQILGLQKEIDETDKKRPKPKFDADTKSLEARQKHARGLLDALDKEKPTPKADLDLSAFFNARGTLVSSLNSIPDETVNVYIQRRGAGHGDGTGGGPDLGYGSGRVAATGRNFGSGFQIQQTRAASRSASVRELSPRRTVVEVRLIPAELDWSKAKTQINGEVRVIAGDVFVEQYQEERNFERQQR